jgi:hypothetical protein
MLSNCVLCGERKDLKINTDIFYIPPAPVTLKVILMPMPTLVTNTIVS